MRIPHDDAISRLRAHDHGVLSTLHPERGIDSVPVVYFTDGVSLVIPIDTVKPKTSPVLQREKNLDSDPRAVLLIDHWDRDDWSQLWWVRAELHWTGTDSEMTGPLADGLVDRYPQYVGSPFHHLLTFSVESSTGWSAIRESRSYRF